MKGITLNNHNTVDKRNEKRYDSVIKAHVMNKGRTNKGQHFYNQIMSYKTIDFGPKPEILHQLKIEEGDTLVCKRLDPETAAKLDINLTEHMNFVVGKVTNVGVETMADTRSILIKTKYLTSKYFTVRKKN